ncbi:maltose transport system [Erysipelotrichaceae bacterium]|nr:maltose transport system [Erysipelotrichaceae bacterium]
MNKFLKVTATALLAFALVACGGQSKDVDKSKVLKVSMEESYMPFIESIRGAFEEEHGITLEITTRPMFDSLDGLALEGPAGNAADVFMLPHDRIGPLVTAGQLAQVSLDDADAYPKKAVQAATFLGDVYMAPQSLEGLILYYNKDLMPTAPTSFLELEALVGKPEYAFSSEEGKSTAFLANFLDMYYAYGAIAGYGGYAFGDMGTNPEDIGLNNAGSVEALTYIKKWYDIYPQGLKDAEGAASIIKDSFNSGKTAAIIEGPWMANDLNIANIGYAVIPELPNGGEFSPFAGVKGWGISNFSTNKELANSWLNYITNEENNKTYYEQTKEVPATIKNVEIVKASNDLLSGTVAKQFENAQPMPNIPEMSAIWDFKGTLFEAASGSDIQTAADNGVIIIKEAIA